MDAVCVSGGEPTLQPGLAELLAQIKELGFFVKLDTNGSRPAVLKQLVADGLVDYVAMDVKNSPTLYAQTTGLPQIQLKNIEESLQFLFSGMVDYELRTTLVAELHDEQSILEMGQWLQKLATPKKAKALFLQSFVDRESVLFAGLHAPDADTLQKYTEILTPYVEKVSVRGTET